MCFSGWKRPWKKKQKEKRTKERERETFKGKPPLTVNFNQKCLIISNAKKMVEQEIPIEKLSEKKENVMAKTIWIWCQLGAVKKGSNDQKPKVALDSFLIVNLLTKVVLFGDH